MFSPPPYNSIKLYRSYRRRKVNSLSHIFEWLRNDNALRIIANNLEMMALHVTSAYVVHAMCIHSETEMEMMRMNMVNTKKKKTARQETSIFDFILVGWHTNSPHNWRHLRFFLLGDLCVVIWADLSACVMWTFGAALALTPYYYCPFAELNICRFILVVYDGRLRRTTTTQKRQPGICESFLCEILMHIYYAY